MICKIRKTLSLSFSSLLPINRVKELKIQPNVPLYDFAQCDSYFGAIRQELPE